MENTNLEWLNSVTPIKTELWQTDRVIKLHEVDEYPFYRTDPKTYKGFIDPKNIKGIFYAYRYNYYDDINWVELLNRLKNFNYIRRNFKTFEALEEHIRYDYPEGKNVAKFGNTLITTCGQHRLALAKFIGISKVEVDISEYEFDSDKFNSYHKMKNQIADLMELGFLRTDFEITPENFRQRFIGIEISGEYFSFDTYQLDEFLRYVKRLGNFHFYHRIALVIETKLRSIFPEDRCIEKIEDIHSHGLLLRKHKSMYRQNDI